MKPIIRQTDASPGLPDLRNLGTILRILVAVNAGVLVAGFASESTPSGMVAAWTQASAMVEPWLFVVLAVLWAASPWLARRPYATGAALVVLVVLVTGLALSPLYARFTPVTAGSLLRWLIWALLATGILLAYFHLRARALSPAITEARLQALQARIRPHFLFNSINAVLSLVRTEPKRAEIALQDMADLFRVLMRDNRKLAPLADEVELCRQYLELEQLRLGPRLVVEWNVKSMPGDALVPPLVLQPLLENAVYHGIEPWSAPGTVSVNLFSARGEVHAILRNPYRTDGGTHHSGNKMAMANVRERLALHFDAEASLETRVTKDAYEVHIRMPYRPDRPAASGRDRVEAAPPARPGADPGAARRESKSAAPLPPGTRRRVAHG